MSIICAFQFNVEVERGALRSLIGGMSNRFPGNRVSRDRPVLPLPLRRQNGSKLCFKGIPRVAAEASSEYLGRGGGTNLAEVYAVKIENIDDESPGDLYGTVTVQDHTNTQTIFDRKSDKAESIGPGENALLIGPTEAILASQKFSIDVALFDGHSRKSSPDDTPISQGQISWSFNNSTNKYEEPIPHTIFGANGSATVVYAVLRNAVQASVVVTMIAGSINDSPSDVYGNITASNTIIPTGKTVLFRKTPPDHTIVNPGDNIPLDRFIVPVPLGSESNLIVQAHLLDYDTDDIITKGSASFPVKPDGISDKKILGKLRNLEVKVTWTNIKH